MRIFELNNAHLCGVSDVISEAVWPYSQGKALEG